MPARTLNDFFAGYFYGQTKEGRLIGSIHCRTTEKGIEGRGIGEEMTI